MPERPEALELAHQRKGRRPVQSGAAQSDDQTGSRDLSFAQPGTNAMEQSPSSLARPDQALAPSVQRQQHRRQPLQPRAQSVQAARRRGSAARQLAGDFFDVPLERAQVTHHPWKGQFGRGRALDACRRPSDRSSGSRARDRRRGNGWSTGGAGGRRGLMRRRGCRWSGRRSRLGGCGGQRRRIRGWGSGRLGWGHGRRGGRSRGLGRIRSAWPPAPCPPRESFPRASRRAPGRMRSWRCCPPAGLPPAPERSQRTSPALPAQRVRRRAASVDPWAALHPLTTCHSATEISAAVRTELGYAPDHLRNVTLKRLPACVNQPDSQRALFGVRSRIASL